MRGHVFVALGDLTLLSADAVAYSTDRALSPGGQLTSAFEANLPTFDEQYTALRFSEGQRRPDSGETFWLPMPEGMRPRGVVVTVATGRRERREQLAHGAVAASLAAAAANLERVGVPKPWRIALPAFLTGDGGARNDRLAVAEPQLEAAEEFVAANEDIDVAFVPARWASTGRDAAEETLRLCCGSAGLGFRIHGRGVTPMNTPYAAAACATALLASTLASPARAAWPTRTVAKANLVGEAVIEPANLAVWVGLLGFSFKFQNGDHKLRALGFLPGVTKVYASFLDANGDDPWAFSAKYVVLPFGTSQYAKTVTTKMCNGECFLDLEKPPAGFSVFALHGFRFRRGNTTDMNIRRIALRHNAAANKLEVVYRDNSSSNVWVEVQYAYLKDQAVHHSSTVKGTRSGGQEALFVKTPQALGDSQAVLRGFDVRFENGDHHLKEFAIQRVKDGFQVRFNDQNTDDPYTADIDYALLSGG